MVGYESTLLQQQWCILGYGVAAAQESNGSFGKALGAL